ncbi:hypothetical protein ILYODFUR_034038 [Ilyodon furcidens]|uniref:Uncharacterized protein n=1 Tax=Ilyodon furcidens TaxID=33524 RepID=A0ABV0TQB4_9TELE
MHAQYSCTCTLLPLSTGSPSPLSNPVVIVTPPPCSTGQTIILQQWQHTSHNIQHLKRQKGRPHAGSAVWRSNTPPEVQCIPGPWSHLRPSVTAV